jgi:hypothetical protein
MRWRGVRFGRARRWGWLDDGHRRVRIGRQFRVDDRRCEHRLDGNRWERDGGHNVGDDR